MNHDLDQVVTQAEFGELVGISQPAVSALVQAGVLVTGATCSTWLHAYCARLREQAAARLDASGCTDLAHERALLARSQRVGQEQRNAVARSTYAPADVLADLLAQAARSVLDRFDQIPADLADLPPAALGAITRELDSARREFLSKTRSLTASDVIDEADLPVEDDPADPLDSDDDQAGPPDLSNT